MVALNCLRKMSQCVKHTLLFLLSYLNLAATWENFPERENYFECFLLAPRVLSGVQKLKVEADRSWSRTSHFINENLFLLYIKFSQHDTDWTFWLRRAIEGMEKQNVHSTGI